MKKILFLLVLGLLLCVRVEVAAQEEKTWNLEENRRDYDINITEMGEMDTKELLSNVLENPYLIDLLAYDDFSVALSNLIDEYHSIKELYERDDLIYAFMNQHSKMSKNKLEVKVIFTNLLISYPVFLEKCDDIQKNLLKNLIISNTNEYLEKNSIMDYSVRVASSRFDMEPFEITHTNCEYSTTVYTYSGSSVQLCIVHDVHDGSTAINLQNMVRECYPNAITLELPSLQYNCHSFAWHFGSQSNLTNNRGVIHGPSIYISDESYTEEQVENLVTNDTYKVAYMQGGSLTHSGVIESYNNNEIEVISKWGVLGLYRHKIDETPYYNCTYKFYKHSNHTYYMFTANSNGLTHKSTCRCTYTCNQPHEYVLINGNYECSKCHYIFQSIRGGN